MPYFEHKELRKDLISNTNGALRQCQLGSLLALLGHFTASTEPAIISLPTGAGKTELMISAAFCLDSKAGPKSRPIRRALFIEPTRFLRNQTAERLRKLEVFRINGLIGENFPICKVRECDSLRKDANDWEELRAFDAVVSTPKTVSPAESNVAHPPDDLFDVIFIDEAQHATAKTWRTVIKAFPSAKVVLMTATAFRRDRRRLPGRLVYHYPVGKALETGIYRPVRFLPVARRRHEDLDRDMARKVVEKFDEELALNPTAALMIRTDRIAKCEAIRELYRELGIQAIEIIHSDLPKGVANQRLQNLRDGRVNAVVTVGMMAEGIDVPGLKIAALHASPKTLPTTIQLVGRVSRTTAQQEGSAWLIAVPEEVRGEARQLFREDRDWAQFIPELVEDAIRDAHGAKADIVLNDTARSSLIPENLQPFFSAQLFEFVDPAGRIHDELLPLDIDLIKGLPRSIDSIEFLASPYPGCIPLVTRTTESPVWGRETNLADVVHDLHMLYAPEDTGMLFVATTSPIVIKAILAAKVEDARFIDKCKLLDPRRVQAALSDASPDKYSSVGLENALGSTGTHPSYRMHLGSGSGSSVRPTDGAIYGPGHAMGRTITDALRGIAVKNRRVWEIRRGSLSKFVEWCNEIVTQVRFPGEGLPGLSFLSQPVPAHEIFDGINKPIAVMASDRLFMLPPSSIEVSDDPVLRGNIVPAFEVNRIRNDGTLAINFFFNDSVPGIELCYSSSEGMKHWQVEDRRKIYVVDPDSGLKETLDSFLNENSPIIIMEDGGAVRGDYGWKILNKDPKIPDHLIVCQNWEGVDIKKEAREGEDGRQNVQQKTLELLAPNYPKAVIVQDDGAYEISDFILVDADKKTIIFIHCKYSSHKEPGNRVGDWNELFAQCCRSQAWIRRAGLILELLRRLDQRESTCLIDGFGSRKVLEKVRDTYRPNEWSYHVRAVQPGCDKEKILREEQSHTYRGLSVVREWLLQANASFDVWSA